MSGSHKARHLIGHAAPAPVVERPGHRPALDRPHARHRQLRQRGARRGRGRPGGRTAARGVRPDLTPSRRSSTGSAGSGRTSRSARASPASHGDPTVPRGCVRPSPAGAMPFTCQGNENGLAIEGGQTLGYEMATRSGQPASTSDRLSSRSAGGAGVGLFAGASRRRGARRRRPSPPRFDTVQTTRRAAPGACVRARARRASSRRRDGLDRGGARHTPRPSVRVHVAVGGGAHSVAHGILDDETYDWLAVVRGCSRPAASRWWSTRTTLRRRTSSVRARPADRRRPHRNVGAGRAARAPRTAARSVRDERVAVLFTGARRGPDRTGARR